KAVVRRRDLGLLAGMNSDKVNLVPEDPGVEPLDKIHKETAEYIEKAGNCPYEMFETRGDGIRKAVFDTVEPTVILVTGKGGETRQLIGREYIDCPSDSEFAQMYIEEYDKANE
ncbi:MAG TPA: UDP-N-acetylmuramoyl-L-alanyl-D-glutamate--2,6-diaminopimelate ligase, partial [Lachnospiraceae bacterium]|nr:UDP-N-acetylmuramoyl-L-alanyl-D-glutamate--2,6-diaminopimelate ligase [Lachnospiraceae bacterium]